MAFYGYLETFIHFHSLRNIDLFHQGLYQVRCHVYREYGPGDILAAVPWRITTSPLESASEHRKARAPRDTHCLAPAYITHPNKSFTTRTFQIRFCDEEVELNDGVTFRLEIDLTKPSSYSAPLFVEFQLMYAEAPPSEQQRNKRKSEGGQSNGEKKHVRRKHRAASASPCAGDFLASPLRDEKTVDRDAVEEEGNVYQDLSWIVAAYQVMKLQDPIAGQSAYTQATFDHLHFCVCHCTIYTALVDIRQGLHQPCAPPVLEPRHNQRKLAPTLNAASQNKEPATERPSDGQGQVNPQHLTTPRDTAPYWSPSRASPVTDIYHTSGNMTLLDHLAAATKCFNSIQGVPPGEEEVVARRLTVDFGQAAPMVYHKPLPRNTLGPGLLVPPEAEVAKIVLSRAERVYREYLTLLTRTYYHLRAYIITISYRCLSEVENRDLNWIWMSGKQFYLPGKLTIEAKPNGLPEQSINLSDASKLGTLSFVIPAHICIDAAQEMLETNDLRIAGATRSITLPFYPLSARLRSSLPVSLSDPADAPFIADLQAIFIEDFNLVWSQLHDAWQKLKVLVSLVHKETQYFHQMIWEKRIAARCREVVYLELNSARSASTPVDKNIGLLHNQIADELRASKKLQSLPPLPVEDVHGGFDPATHPIIFEERYSEDLSHKGLMGGYLEKRDRLSNIHGGLRGCVPEGITSPSKIGMYKPLELHKLKAAEIPDAGEIILTNRQRGTSADTTRQATPQASQTVASPKAPFEDLKALALMKQAEDETNAANTLALPRAQSPHLLQMPANVPDVSRHISGCTTLDSIDSSMEPADEDVSLTEEDLRFLKVYCPVFEQVSLAPKLYAGSHLIVLVHGFQGNAMDMRLLRNQFSLVFPEGLYLASTSNEEQTEGDLSAMGSRLAAEVLTYMAELCPADSIGRVSFVGHSLGGLIIRAALPHLSSISHKFHLFLTLSSPHLGYIFARNRLVDAGLWVLKKWKKSIGLQQLSMSDHRDPRSTFLYKLSQRDDLKYFAHVVFVSCFQDQYIPYESARVEISTKIKSDPQWGSVHTEMVKNILATISMSKLVRLDTCFKIADRSIDTLIGRTAHIQFLGSQQLAQIIVMTYPQWFA